MCEQAYNGGRGQSQFSNDPATFLGDLGGLFRNFWAYPEDKSPLESDALFPGC
jgi:hypothetical protein